MQRSALFSFALILCPAAVQAAAIFTGSIDAADPQYRREENDGSGLVAATDTKKLDVHYDTFSFVADASGVYSLSATYGFNGFLAVYKGSFLPSNATTNLSSGDVGPLLFGPLTSSLIPSGNAFGPDVSGPTYNTFDGVTVAFSGGPVPVRTLNLTPGQTYVAVVSGYDDTQFGSYTLNVTGGAVPEPAGLALIGGAATSCLYRRRSARKSR